MRGTKESLKSGADVYNVSVSEYVRGVIEKGREYDEEFVEKGRKYEDLQERLKAREVEIENLRERLDAREARIEELETQLSRRSQIEEKIEALPDKVRDMDTYGERRQQLLDEASLAQRAKWKVTDVPVEKIAGEGGVTHA